MFNNTEFEKEYLLKADDVFVKCMQIHQDISTLELVLQKHGITTPYEKPILIDTEVFTLKWHKHNGCFRLTLGMFANDRVHLNECDNYIKEKAWTYLTRFLEELVTELTKHESKKEDENV